MSKYIPIVIGLLLSSYSQPALSQSSQPWKLFELERLVQKNKTTEGSYLRFLNESSLSMGLYELKAGMDDLQNPHQLDEVYYIVKGEALLVAGKDTTASRPGTIAYVKSNVSHRFVDITEDLQVLVIFSKTESSPDNPIHQITTLDELNEKRESSKNVWNQFLDVSTMRMGLYILPQSVGGDETLTHEVDEINIVVGGSGTFVVDQEEFKVEPGSIFYVEQDHGHRFKDLQDEKLDILILFHRE